MSAHRHRSPLLTVALLLGPPLLLIPALALDWVDVGSAVSTLIGCAIAAVGGVLTGLVAERLLHRGESSTHHLIGLAGATVLGVLTVGYLYLIHLRGPITGISTSERTVSQTLVFVAFLTAQVAGILITG